MSDPLPPGVDPRFRARTTWPPDFSVLTPNHQFSLERRYRRRTQLKWARPTLMKVVKTLQFATVVGGTWYCVFWADWGTRETPFEPIREWVREKRSVVFGDRSRIVKESKD
ncbi:hypothetical protein BJ508DRAFT_416287 [Ascobolus immersus RN42]|uniref:Uncharacterized protein n=1 Tax=Ascobolus immersus RN42 TaxID=1160509 RepID=A0A3N4HYM9_ASCIM|nr:hypothetical protein BJ508DRAFT_416287 [Ascobolus immersus RN42]